MNIARFRQKEKGQIQLFIILGIFLIIGAVLYLGNTTRSTEKVISDISNQEGFESSVTSFVTSTKGCLHRLLASAWNECESSTSPVCREHVMRYLKLQGPTCFDETSFEGLTIATHPPMNLDVEITPRALEAHVTLRTVFIGGNIEKSFESYTVTVRREEAETAGPASPISIAGQTLGRTPVISERKQEPYVLGQALVTYKRALTPDEESRIQRLAIISRKPVFDRSLIESGDQNPELSTLLEGLAQDELITFDERTLPFETLERELQTIEAVDTVSRNTKSFGERHVLLSDWRARMLGFYSRRQNDPLYGLQWHLENSGQLFGTPGVDIDINEAWKITKGKPETIIAIIDEGVFPNPDFASHLLLDKSQNLVTGGSIVPPRLDDTHGTHVAGLISAEINNKKGVAGICPGCRIISMNVMTGDTGVDSRTLLTAVLLSVSRGARIISMSLGGTAHSPYEERVFSALAEKGIIFIAAAGNDGIDEKNYPAAYPGVIAVGATDNIDSVALFSNYGDWVDIYAPGDLILSSCGTTTFCFKSGTSMATPIVSGVVGLMRTLNPDLSGTETLALLQEHGVGNGQGMYRLKASGAVKAVKPSKPTS